MFKSLVPVNKERHADTKIKLVTDFEFARDFHLASVMVHEFVRAASVYPIVFIEDNEADSFRPIVLLGLNEGENLFVDTEGKWSAAYVPAIIRRYPFALARTQQEGQFTVCIDEGSSLISTDDGSPLFDDQGEPTKVVENVRRYLGELQAMEEFTKDFCRFFVGHNLFTPLNMRVRDADTLKNITGCYVINEERLQKLSDTLFLEMRTKGFLPAVYSHLTSLGQVERLSMLRKERSESQADAGTATDAVH